MSDVPGITTLMLADHQRLRLGFMGLVEAPGQEELSNTWEALSARLEAHAEAEELIFYPALAGCGWLPHQEGDDPVKDHNRIRAAIHDADAAPVGSDRWWDAVGRAKAHTSKHLAKEEADALPAFRRHAGEDMRRHLARAWLGFYATHRVELLDTGCGESANRFVPAHTDGQQG